MENKSYFLNDIQIKKAIANCEMAICPFLPDNLTPVGYNLSYSRFIVSLSKKTFVKIQKKDREWFFYLKPSETVLILTRESIWVSKFIGGTFHSKVSLVTKGLGHVSTTLDPGWRGQLLVPLNNPTKEKIKIIIAKEIDNEMVFETFITMILFRSQEAALNEKIDNKSARIELLEEILESKKRNKDAEHLNNFIKELKNNEGYLEIEDLNDPTGRKQKITNFENEHRKMLKKMDNEFDRINRLSTKNHGWGMLQFIIITIATVLLLITAYIGCTSIQKGKYKEYASIGISIIVPFIIMWLTHMKDKKL